MECGVCGTNNKEGRAFCKECGNALAVTCSNCGAANEPGDKFCGICGDSLGDGRVSDRKATTVAAEVAAPVVAEQRFVSVLFADIVGYTTLSEHRDSEDIRDLLTVYFDRAREIIERFGGAVDKFIGDAVMGVWGALIAREDDAQRAVRAALELVDMVRALGEELDLPDLVLRAGVNSGTTSVGPGGNEKGLVVGDLVNTASRLQSIAEPGTVFVGSATYAVTKQSIDYQDIGELTVKGKTDPVHAFQARRVASLVAGRTDDEIRMPPFVGRDRELRLLKDGLAAVEAENRARLISIVGEAGIGKTRLAEEFKNHIDGYSETIYWHWGRSPSYGEGVTFWALGEIVRQRAGILEGDELSRARTRLRTMLAEFVPTADDRDWIEPRLAGLLGLAEMPAGSRSELFGALRSFFQNIARRGPTVLVLEDLHWADSGLLDFIGELVERSTKSPILVVTLARPDLLDRSPEWGSQHRSSMGVRLGPLPEGEMRHLVSEYIPGVDENVVDQVVERVAGFPLYAVEIVRMLTGSGDLAFDGTQFAYVGDPSEMALPDTLLTVIGARLDRIDPDQRGVLQDGAVLGLTFTVASIATLRDEPAELIEKKLSPLINLELLDLEDDPRSPERGQYRFVQGLIREVAYNRLNRNDRKSKHLAAADYFEGFDDPELAGVISGHYMGAYQATPTGGERQALAERALGSLTHAATRAAQLHSHLQAMSLLDQAIELAPDELRQAELRLQASESADRQGEVDRGLAYLAAARAVFEAAGDTPGVRRSVTAQSGMYNSHFRSAEALEVVEPVYADLGEVADAVSVALAAEAGRSFALNFRHKEALEAINRLLPAAAELEMVETTLDSVISKALALFGLGRRVEAFIDLRGAAIEAERRGYLARAQRGLNNLASVLALRNPVEATRITRENNELSKRVGDFRWIVRTTADLAESAWLDGRYEEATDLFHQIDEEQLSDWWRAAFNDGYARIELRRTGSEEARDTAMKWLDYFADSDDAQVAAYALFSKAQVHRECGEWEAAFDSAIQVDPQVAGEGSIEAAHAAGWLRDRDKVRSVIELSAPVPQLTEYLLAIDSALTGQAGQAAEKFEAVLEYWSPRLTRDQLSQVRATFAYLIGTDHPSAAQAAQDAYHWCIRTGTKSLLNAWAPVMPRGDGQVAAAG